MPERPTPEGAEPESGTIRATLQGGLLIAVPRLQDPNFHRMVVFLIHHSETGAFGLVLGPASNTTMTELCQALEVTWDRPNPPPLRYGGPCEPSRIWVLHGNAESLLESETIAPGIHLGSSVALLEVLNRRADVKVAAFAGYAGWGPGQLEHEMQQNSWLPGDVTPELVFDTPPEKVWEEALRPLALSPGLITSKPGASA